LVTDEYYKQTTYTQETQSFWSCWYTFTNICSDTNWL